MRNSSSLCLVENYQNDDSLRAAYQKYVSKIFPGIDIEEWYRRGFWNDTYIPISLINSGEIVSNVSVAKMTVLFNGAEHSALQISAVGTMPAYRNRGLSRKLLEYTLDKYRNEVSFFFLYANETVLEFYPKFGFQPVMESVFITETEPDNSAYVARKLDISKEVDYDLLQKLLNKRQAITERFGATNYQNITIWHIFNFYSDHLYYLEDPEALLIKSEKDSVLHLYEIIFHDAFDLQSVLPKIIESDKIKSIRYYFPPDKLPFQFHSIQDDDTGLFILGDFNPGEEPFRFPVTAVT